MKFAQFLIENDETQSTVLSDIVAQVEKEISAKAKNSGLYTDGDLYVVDYTKADAEVTTKEILGYFIYKKDAEEGDDFYIGKYIYRIAKGEADILVDDVKESFTTIADADLHIKNKLKGNIPK